MKNKHRRDYAQHKSHSKKRGIPFELEYWEWLQIWQDSGHIHEMGTRKGEWVMARFGDTGPYSATNVRIVRVETNLAEQQNVRRARLALAT